MFFGEEKNGVVSTIFYNLVVDNCFYCLCNKALRCRSFFDVLIYSEIAAMSMSGIFYVIIHRHN